MSVSIPVKNPPLLTFHECGFKERASRDFEMFEKNLLKMNLKFTDKISRKYPGLTKMELKLCSLLKISLGTKEIAKLLCVSVRTVENHRHNIIRKLKLPKGKSLQNFISAI